MAHTHRLTARDGGLLIVDLQRKLVDLVPQGARVVANAARLIDAAQALAVPVWATEQYPKGLGPTVETIAERVPHRPSKTGFSCCSNAEILEQILARGLRHLTLAGIEAHVCIAQTALDLLRHGITVQVVADAVASRADLDCAIALRRLEHAGAILSTTEAAMFEWVESSDHPAFKTISALVKAGDRLSATSQERRSE